MFEHVINQLFQLQLDSYLPYPNTNLPLSSDDVFGVFVTIHRFNKLNTWPTDIHGCIGHIEPNQRS